MSGFKDMVAADNAAIFLNLGEFADKRTVRFDGEEFVDIPVVLSGLRNGERPQRVSDHAQGLYLVSRVLHCREADLGGVQPEEGQTLRINDREGGGGFFQSYKVASSVCDMGMVRVELEAIEQ